MEKSIFVVPQKAAIERDGKLLIFKRAAGDDIYPLHWELPGGKLEQGESPKEGLQREVKEETGLEIKIIKPVFSFVDEVVKGRFAFILIYKCEMVSDEIKLNKEEVTEFKWATKKELLELECEPYLKAYIEGEMM